MAEPHFKVILEIEAPTWDHAGKISGSVKAVGADFQPMVCLQLYKKDPKELISILFGPVICPLLEGAETTYATLGLDVKMPVLKAPRIPGEYMVVASAFDSPGSPLYDEARATFMITAPPE